MCLYMCVCICVLKVVEDYIHEYVSSPVEEYVFLMFSEHLNKDIFIEIYYKSYQLYVKFGVFIYKILWQISST